VIGHFSVIVMVAQSSDIAAGLKCIQLRAAGIKNRLKHRYLHLEVAVHRNLDLGDNTVVSSLERCLLVFALLAWSGVSPSFADCLQREWHHSAATKPFTRQ
jgi:hypothetical protein